MTKRTWAGLALCLIVATQAKAVSPLEPYVEHEKRLRTSEMVSPLTSELFGDSVSLYNGSTEFSVTDIDLPGNNALPVQLRRRFKVGSFKEVEPLGGFGAWEVDVPYIYGTFDGIYKWDTASSGSTARCSQNWVPKTDSPFTLREIWHGNQMHIPGAGEQEVLFATGTVPGDGQTYTRGAKGFYRFRCKANTANGYPGEGFIAIDTNGTKYTFDIGIERGAGVMKINSAQRARIKVYLMASRVEDRHGNWVDYHYSGDKLVGISSSDGRDITIAYSGNTIVQASAHGRNWYYRYTGGGGALGLSRYPWLNDVELPDGQHLTYQYQSDSPFGALNTNYTALDSDPASCSEPDYDANSFTLTASHPSGAVGTFYFPYIRLHRSGTPKNACVMRFGENYVLTKADYFDLYALSRKTITGPGLPPMEWTYNYGDTGPGRTPCADCPSEKTVSVKAIDKSQTMYRFGIWYGVNEGRLLSTDTVAPDGTVVRTQSSTYVTDAEAASMPFPGTYGDVTGGDDLGLAMKVRPVKQTTVVQDGVTFSSTINAFDGFARPTSVSRSNTMGYSRSEATAYYDNTARWVLGQVSSVTQTSPAPAVVVEQTDYDAADLPWRRYQLGLLKQTLTYYGDATLATVKDGNGNTTTLSSWKRGVPQAIIYPDLNSQSAAVDDNGWIRSITEENGFATRYDYDLMGRLTLVDYPDYDGPNNWNNTVSSFEKVNGNEYGLPANHWRHTVSTGNARKVTYFDGFWRPVVEEQYDVVNVAGTLSQTVKRYDENGRLAFQSYPLRGLTDFTAAAQGTTTLYDPLDRVTRVEQSSEWGALATQTEYLPGLQVRVTNPRWKATTTSYMAYDQPTTDWPVLIAQPEGVFTDIVRDSFGKPTSLRRRNADGTLALTRRYVYDGYQRLCKAIEPETGATVMDYDAAGNLSWSAGGLSLTDPASCNTAEGYASDSRAQRSYDVMNRPDGLTYPGVPGSDGDQTWEYWPDGKLKKIVTVNDGLLATNEYSYNKRRLLVSESLSQMGGETWGMGYGYDVNGNLDSITYPSGLAVAYAPNALGQVTQAGSYATGVSYHPNGAMAQFTYGNGIVHTLTQNARGLPERSRDANSATVLDDTYDYDPNGNVAGISDAIAGNRGDRLMTYDGLDRLLTTASPMYGGAGTSYSYDVLDNLTRVTAPGRNYFYCYDTRWQLTNLRTVGCDTGTGSTEVALGYDVRGNVDNRNGQVFTFDVGNRLREVENKEAYRYDAHGRRIQASSPAGTILSMYGQDGVLRRQRNEREAKAHEYVMLNGSLVARVSTLIAPAVPVVTATPTYTNQGNYTVQWTAPQTATTFEVQESFNGGAWQAFYSGSALSQPVSGKGTGIYRYQARARNGAGWGGWSAFATATVDLPPAGPPVLSVPHQGDYGNYTISWSQVGGATWYQLEESANDGGSWTVYDRELGPTKDFSNKPAGAYIYRIKACNPVDCSAYASGANSVQALYPPSVPVVALEANNYNGSYGISWTASAGALRYELVEQFNSGAPNLIHNAAANGTSVGGKTNGNYTYQVKACHSLCSDPSAPKTITVLLPPPSPAYINAPAASPNGNYTVSWAAAPTANSYRLEESANGGPWVLVYAGPDAAASISGRGNGQYSYRAFGCNANCSSNYSPIGTTSVLLPPPVPHITIAEKYQTPKTPIRISCNVAWTGAAGAASYELKAFSSSGNTLYNGPSTSVNAQGASYCASSYVVRACNTSGCSAWSAPPFPQTVIILELE